MQALEHLIEAMLKATLDGLSPEANPITQQLIERSHTRSAVHADHVEIDPIITLEIRGGKQVTH